MTAVRVRDILKLIEQKTPAATAESWDNVGLLSGDPDWTTPGAVVSIDLTREAIELAKSKGYRLIVNHHPAIFPRQKGLARVTPDSLVFEAIREGIAVIATHTNFDQCALEVVESVSSGLGVVPLGRLHEKSSGQLLKLAVFVPEDHVDAVRNSICEAGAGQIGQYDICTFQTAGQGTFRGAEGTHPFLGKPGQLERGQEVKLETILPRGLQKPVIKALLDAHPYEEVAFDLFPVEQGAAEKGLVRGLGYGFWGELKSPAPLSVVTAQVRKLFQVEGCLLTPARTAGADPMIKRLGYVAGKGASFAHAARARGCDLFITGEAGYHLARELSGEGLSTLELGHPESELFFHSTVMGWLAGLGLHVSESRFSIQKFLA
jgi:dinuclear metal center YbgI/SA1388 family protein